MALTREELLRQFGALAKQQQQKKVVPQVSKPVVKPTWTEAKAPVTAESQVRDFALAQRVVSTTPGALGYGVARGVSMPVTATAKLLGYQESPEEAAVRTLAESKRLTAQMDASKGMGAPNIIQGRSVSPEMVGRVVGSVLPFSAAESAVGRVLPTLAGQGIAKTAARGAVAGGALQGLEEAGQGKRGAELAKSVAIGTALGAGADIGLGYLGKAIRSIKAGAKTADVVADIAQNAPQTKVTIEQELGLPEGSSWLDIQRKMEEEDAVEALYQKYETMKAPERPVTKPSKQEIDATTLFNKREVPENVYVHGRATGDELSEGNVIQLTKDWDIAEQYAGKQGSKWAMSPKPTAKVLDATNDNERIKIARDLISDFEDDALSYDLNNTVRNAVEEYGDDADSVLAELINPEKIVDSAGVWDDPDFAPWLYEKYGYDFAKTNDGAVVINKDEMITSRVGEESTKAKGLAPEQQPTVDIERELFPSVMRQPSTGTTLPEPAIITAQRRAHEALRPMAPEPQVITPQVKPAPSAAIPERMAVDSEIGVASKSVPERMAQETSEIGVGTLDVKAGIQPGQKQSKLYTNTIPKSEMFTPQELENLQIEFEGGYTPKANAETLANAKTRIAQNGADAELEALKQKDTFNSDDFVTSMEILKDKVLREARETGDYSKVTEMLELIRKSGSTEAGRVVQAHQIYSRTPEGMLALAKKVVDNVNAKGGKATLTPDDIRNIDDSMRRFQDLPPGRDKDAELSKVKQIIADKVPATFIEKYRSLQRILWLLNPKTLITRNPLGNIILQGAEGIKNVPATGLDYLIGLKTGKRTTTMAGGYLEGAKKGLKEQFLDIKQGVDTAPTGGQAEIPRGKVWDSAELEGVNKQIVDTLDKLDNRVGQLLKLGDRPFYEGAYNSRINQLKKLNKTGEVTEAMVEDARLYALERTLQKDSELAKTFQRIKTASDNPAWQVFANTLLPFTKTPANILDKMFEYSPGGFIKAATQIGKKGDAFDQKYFVDNVSRALTGTGLMALGYIGAKNGFITGKPDKDKEVAAVERLIGRLPYAFVTDGGSYTFDWAQPVSALLAIGADAYYGGKDKETFAEQLSGSAEAAGNTFFNLGMLQGITRAFGGYSPTVGLIKSTTEGVSGLSTPAITSQTAKTIDPYVRETDKQLSKKILAKTPGASFLLEPKLDLYGRPIKQSEGRGVAARALENFLSPGFYATGAQSTPGLKEAYRVYKATGEKDIFPRLAPETITVKGDVKKLTPELKVEFQKDMGAANLKSIETLIKSSAYKSATDDDKAKMLNDLIKDNREATKKKLMPKIEKLP